MRLNRSRLTTLSMFLTAVAAFSAPSASQAQLIGIENEYATVGFIDPTGGPRTIEAAKKMLESVKSQFGAQGEIRVEPWKKRPESGLKQVILTDAAGRDWEVVPESVNTGRNDGLEFVSPPLATEDEFKKLESVLKVVKSTKTVMRGLRSGGHMTIDVSHLLRDRSNVSDLVDLILTIENHWAEIYGVFDPVRYGRTINRFSIPLAADQQGLLAELAALPKEQRSFDRVKSLFEKYTELERKLRDSDGKNSGRMWKYRAANYGKLFALNGNSQLPVVEFRIGDLETGSRLVAKMMFLRALVNSAAQFDKDFKFPFGKKPLAVDDANRALYKNVLSGLNMKWLGALGLSKLPETRMERSAQNLATREPVELIDANLPVEWNGKYASLGFEAEFRGDREANIVYEDAVKLKRFPFLDSNYSKEYTGNTEVRSLGGEWRLSEVIEQMVDVKSELGPDLRSFHLHMRVPKEAVEAFGKSEFHAWMGLIGDSIFAWRLQYRKHFFALKTHTQSRSRPTRSDLSNRGTVRVTEADDIYDIELRGYMNSEEMIGAMVQRILTGLKNPKSVRANALNATDLRIMSSSLQSRLENYVSRVEGRKLNPKEREAIETLGEGINEHGQIPLYDFENLAGLNEHEKRKIRDQNFEFHKKVMAVVRNHIAGKYGSEAEFDKQFRYRIKEWASEIDLHSILESLVLRSVGIDALNNPLRNSRAALRSEDAIIQREARSALQSSDLSEAKTLANKPAGVGKTRKMSLRKITEALEEDYPEARKALLYISQLSTKQKIQLLKVYEDSSPNTIDYSDLLEQMKNVTDVAFLDYLVSQLNSNLDYRITEITDYFKSRPDEACTDALLRAFPQASTWSEKANLLALIGSRSDAKSQNFIQGVSLSKALLNALAEVSSPGNAKFVLRALKTESVGIPTKVAAIQALTDRSSPEASEIFTLAFSNGNLQLHNAAAERLHTLKFHNFKNPAAFAELALQSPSAEARERVIESMARVCENHPELMASIAPPLVKAWNGPHPQDRRTILSFLIGFESVPDSFNDIILKSAKNRNLADFHFHLLKAMKGKGGAEYVTFLKSKFSDRQLSDAAATGLSHRRDRESLEFLLGKLASSNSSTRLLALEGLKGRIEPEALQAVEARFNARDDSSSQAIVETLNSIKRARLTAFGSTKIRSCSAVFGGK